MKLFSYGKIILLIFALAFFQNAAAQTTEILTNEDVVLMSQNALGEDLIVEKIKESKGAFDVSVAALVALKKANVGDAVIERGLNLIFKT